MTAKPSLPDFVFTEKLGSGSYATVYKAYRKGGRREVVAVKCVEKSSLSKTAVDNLVNEIALLKKLKHDFIVNMKEFQWDNTYIYIIMEYCGGGDLSHFIHSRRRLPEKVVKRFLQQLGKALEFLRSQNICHMDLKPQNVLLSSQHNPVLKLGDFGFAQYLRPEDGATSMRGSPLYMAPEILLHQRYDARVDLWSVGVILYECLFGRAPYSSKSFTELAEKIKKDKPIELAYGADVSPDCRDLLLRLLQRDPERRITFEEFFTHPFLDLERMPSPECYTRGVSLVLDAVERDSALDFQEAVRLYCEAVRYFMPAIEFEQDPDKRAAIRQRVEQYVSRAEELKARLAPSSSPEVLSPYRELVELSGDNQVLVAALKVAEEAERLENADRYEEALSKYELALGRMIPMLADEDAGRRGELLRSELRRWMGRAEAVKTFLSMDVQTTSEKRPSSDEQPTSISESLREQCSIQ